MNMLTNRTPTHVTVTDACLSGFGGFAMECGRAWRYEFSSMPATSINVLEFMACVIGIWLELIHNDINKEDVILALTDNASAAGWLHKCNTDWRRNSTRTIIAHHLANLGITHGFIVHPQHIQGKENDAADALSRRFDLTDSQLTHLITTNFSHQIPKTFKVVELPVKISSWISSVLARIQSSENPPQSPMPTVETELGLDGGFSPRKLDWGPIHSSKACLLHPDGNSEDVSSKHFKQDISEKDDTRKAWSKMVQNSFLDGLSAKPLASWLRNSGTTIGLLPSTSKAKLTGSLQAFARYSPRGKTKIPDPNVKQR